MKEQQIVDTEILTIDLPATKEQIRVKFHSPAAYSRLRMIPAGTFYAVLDAERYSARPESKCQAILRQLKVDGVLVEQTSLKEAA